MFEKHKQKKEARIMAQNIATNLQAQEMAKQLISENNNSGGTSGEGSDADRSKTFNIDVLSELMSLRNDIRENIGWIVLGALLIVLSYFLVGITFTVPTFIVTSLFVYMYTKRFYHVATQSVLLIDLQPNKPVHIEFVNFPYKVFQYIDTIGLTNMVFSPDRGSIFLANQIEYSDRGIPVRIKFAWLHFPEHDFVTKKETYTILVEYVNRLVVINAKLKELMDMNTYTLASEMTEQRLKRINEGKMDTVFQLQQEERELTQKIVRLLHENEVIESRREEVPEEEQNE